LIEEEKYDPAKNNSNFIPAEVPDLQKMTSEEIAEASRREIERIHEEQLNEMLAAEL